MHPAILTHRQWIEVCQLGFDMLHLNTAQQEKLIADSYPAPTLYVIHELRMRGLAATESIADRFAKQRRVAQKSGVRMWTVADIEALAKQLDERKRYTACAQARIANGITAKERVNELAQMTLHELQERAQYANRN